MFPTTKNKLPFGALSNPLGAAAPAMGDIQVTGKLPPMGALARAPVAVPVKKAPNIWDKENRSRTFMALAQAFGAGPNFSDGLSAAAGSLGGLMDNLKAKQKKKPFEIGGPDNAFEIHTDEDTGEVTYKPIAAFQDYKTNSRVKTKDVMDQEGRVAYGILDLPEADRPAAFAEILANPRRYNVDTTDWPSAYDPKFLQIAATAGSNVSQNRTRDTADTTAATRTAQADRNLDLRQSRVENLNAATNTRVGLAVSKANKAPSAPPSARKGAGKAGGGMGGRKLGGPTGVMVRVRKKR